MAKRRNNKNAGARGGQAPLHERLRSGEMDARSKAQRSGGGSARGRAGSGPSARKGPAGKPAASVPPEPVPGDPRGRIAIVGGGAAGLAAAVAAGRELALLRCDAPGGAPPVEPSIVVFEAADRVGKSILATGNGRCNFSNAEVSPRLYRNAGFVSDALLALEAADAARLSARGDKADLREGAVRRLFADLGLAWREEGEGRLYPATGKATTVVDVLRAAAASLGAVEACGRRLARIDAPEREGGLFHLRFADGSIEHAAAVVLAVGGRHALMEQGGLLPPRYDREPLRPVLGPLSVEEPVVRALDNIRVRVRATLLEGGAAGGEKASETGELLFRSYGVSGICVFNLSRFAEPGDALSLDFIPGVRACDAEPFLFARRKRLLSCGMLPAGPQGLTGEAFLRGLLLPQVARVVMKAAGIEAEAPFGKADVPALARALKAFPLTIAGIGDERQCQVMRGGLDAARFDPQTMGSRLDAGLFAAGEALDVDAPCGGYNLHWAWASGMLAGMAAVRWVSGVEKPC